jgi:serine/threonine-protein kinase
VTLEPGQTLAHYRLVEELGEGGMGVVWRARDSHLEREVALKVLPAGSLADSVARKRFRREALALSRINHPCIETVHDFDTQEGVDFLVMEYIPGLTLAEKIRQGPLPAAEVTRLGEQLAEGLAAAHTEGVLHRDLKPQNILLRPDGRLKILDFGLATLLPPVGELSYAETLTRTQTAMGTPPYMAPEQLQNEPVDHRTDIFAVGDVLYEMATGRRSFVGETLPQLTESILHQAPVSPRALNLRVSPELEQIILKCLEKNPSNRYQSAQEIAIDLRRITAQATATQMTLPARPRTRWRNVLAVTLPLLAILALLLWWGSGALRDRLAGPAPSARIMSLAVLPLKNLMADPEQQYFVEGMHEALIADLAKIGTVRVISRTSVMRYKDVEISLPEIAQALGVDAIVEGSVLRAGDQVRVTAQLVDGETDTHLWADSYQGDLRDVLSLQRETARAIAREIRAVVTPEEEARLATSHQVDREAYEAYLQGRYHLNRRSQEGVTRGLAYVQQAIDIDPGEGLYHAALADSYIVLAWYDWALPLESLPRARAAALEALRIDDSLAEAHTSLAAVLMLYDWDWAGAEQEFLRALELNRSYPTAHHWYALLLVYTGRYDEAIAAIDRARRLDPYSLIINAVVGYVFYHARQYEDTLRACQRTLEMDPGFSFARHVLGSAYLRLGRYNEAIATAEQLAELSDAPLGNLAGLVEAYALAGQEDKAVKLVAELEEMSPRPPISLGDEIAIYIALGDHDTALELLARAYQERHYVMTTLRGEEFDPLRSDPRFRDLFRRVGLPPL